jgi:hypothetical protein
MKMNRPGCDCESQAIVDEAHSKGLGGGEGGGFALPLPRIAGASPSLRSFCSRGDGWGRFIRAGQRP